MFGGGEEYFQDPPEIDRDTLGRYATFCARLRAIEKPGKRTITEAATLAREVGDTLLDYELVVGALFRHIKTWTGQKQLACWYILDKLCKEDRDKYGYTAGKYILEVGRDHIPYEDADLAGKYESLVEHWENVFPRHVVDALWIAKKERLWAVDHPNEVKQQQQAEEEEWAREEEVMQDEDGLNDFGQPCIDYLQGHCSWGDSCRLYHPPGEEGSLPAECRMGDWKCSACGVINRHFRRRCSNCVREKPQYKKGRVPSAEDKLLCTPDPAVTAAFHQQFGYNPYAPAEAVAHFKLRLEGVSAEEYRKERAAAYRVRILGKAPTNPVEERCKATKHFPDVDMEPDEEYEVGTDGLVAKRQRTESLVPANASPNSAIALLAQLVMERGILDPTVPQIFGELSRYIRQAAGDPTMELNETQAEVLLSACKLGFTAWNANKGAVPSVATFFKAVRHNESKLGLSSEQVEQLESMASMFLA
ncbi:conserved hypothetical protein [Leishmania major strain Friedlin]|uniref:Uncharacterized protein n=1 Tax=Leishmania major TaxID=5664 RepID=Q4Q2J8_LEIMA|nr:conserved hypothetical protein [Leishmania major strain Friedlin]CAG9582223.1 hypothetical_protein_-_conserved [Leishmania major strain Friedlin]CAJ08067.1 conserved hypothetical protein [Leishmania major strain Friedlin]|eukprot:XP_001686450.1 conserved hypothetical protein [Leishmania major strain Friedlin]